jgi:DNA polymerase-3 subunit delta
LILSKRADIDRFLNAPAPEIRAVVVYGRDRGIVRERADILARKTVKDPNDPFDVAVVTEGDIDGDPARLFDELSALSLMGGRRLVRLRLDDKVSADRAAAEALDAHVEGRLNPDAFFLIEAGALGRDSALRKGAEKSTGAAVIPC